MEFLNRILGRCKTGQIKRRESWAVMDNTVVVDLNLAPELKKPESAARIEGKHLKQRLLVVCDSNGEYHAFANKCSHMGRRLDPLPGTDNLECCSVGRSVFTLAGQHRSGLAKEDLTVFRVEKRQERIVIFLD